MKRNLFLFMLVCIPFFETQAQWELVWSDEFEVDGALDATKWKFETGPNWYNGELQYYSNRPENARVEDGKLIIEAIHEEYLGKNYTSARVNSAVGWTYGRFEISARLTNGTALWPAIWMFPDKEIYGGWPKSGEIDIMEQWSWAHNEIFGTIHCEAYYHVKRTEKQGNITVSDPAENFHVYALEWYEDQMRWFVDDVLYFSFYNEGTTKTWPFDHPFHFILNVAIESTAPGKENTWKKRTMEIDWVRVYEGPAKGPAMPVTEIPGKIEAENYINVQGLRTEKCSEGTRNLSYVEAGDWVEYKINVPADGAYTAVFRVASTSSATFDLLSNNDILTQVAVPNTNGWQLWRNVEVPLQLKAGEQTIRLKFNGGVNVNWIEFKEGAATKIGGMQGADIKVFPNPATEKFTFSGLNPSKMWSILLYSSDGKQVKNVVTNDTEISIWVNDLEAGIYLANLNNSEQNVNAMLVKK